MNLLNVSFLAPFALIGLAALAVPIYLHMRHKPRAESFKFPAIDFLLKAQRKKVDDRRRTKGQPEPATGTHAARSAGDD